MSSLFTTLSLLASLFVGLSDGYPHSSVILDARHPNDPSPTVLLVIPDGAQFSIAPPDSTVVANPIPSDPPDKTPTHGRTHTIVACVLALVLVVSCFFFIRYLEWMPFRRRRRRRVPPPVKPPMVGPHTQTPVLAGPEAGFELEERNKAQGKGATESPKGEGDGGPTVGFMPEKPPAVFLLPLSPIEVGMPVLKRLLYCWRIVNHGDRVQRRELLRCQRTRASWVPHNHATSSVAIDAKAAWRTTRTPGE